MAVTFKVADVEPFTRRISVLTAVERRNLLGEPVEALGSSDAGLIETTRGENSFLNAVGLAFASHYPLIRGGETCRMDLLGGFVGVAQCPDTPALRPAIGWAVREVSRRIEPSEAKVFGPLEQDVRERLTRYAGVVLMAGRVSRAPTITRRSYEVASEIVRRAVESQGTPLTCIPSQDLPGAPGQADTPLIARLVVGAPIAGARAFDGFCEPFTGEDIQRAIEVARALPVALWDELLDAMPMGFESETAVILVAYGPLCSGALYFGLSDPLFQSIMNVHSDFGRTRGGYRGGGPAPQEAPGIKIAEVSQTEVDLAVVDCSSGAMAGRAARARAAGVEASEGCYFLLAWCD